LGEPLQNIPSYAIYAHISPQEAIPFLQSQRYQAASSGFRMLSLAYVLGHEIGHHVHGDYGKVDPEVQRQRELDADLFSTHLLLNAGWSPIGAIPIMMFFSEGGPDTSHPPANCRLANYLFEGMPALLADPNFQRYADQNPDVRKSIRDFTLQETDLRSELRQSCGRWFIPSE
jgi:hypothetical protein